MEWTCSVFGCREHDNEDTSAEFLDRQSDYSSCLATRELEGILKNVGRMGCVFVWRFKSIHHLHYTVKKSPTILAAGVFGTGIFHRHIMP